MCNLHFIAIPLSHVLLEEDWELFSDDVLKSLMVQVMIYVNVKVSIPSSTYMRVKI